MNSANSRWPKFTGLNWELHLSQLDDIRSTLRPANQFMAFASDDLDLNQVPEELDVAQFHQLEDQKQLGSCRAHSRTSLAEWVHFLQSGELFSGKTIQFSRQFAYNEIRNIDGIRGDQGCTMRGGIKFDETIGHCLEEHFPYSGRDQRRSPQVCFDYAEFQLKTNLIVESYDEAWRIKAGRIGDIEIGMIWPDCMQQQRVIEEFYIGGRGAGRHAGGHAVAILGWSKRQDPRGRRYFKIQNSWNKRNWENSIDGIKELSPKAFEQILRHPHTVCIGSSHLSNTEPQSWDFINNPIFT